MDRKDELLLHYGVKGQRWGVITRGRAAIGRAIGRRKAKIASESATTVNPKLRKVGRLKGEILSAKRQLNWNKSVKKRKTMTNQELNETLDRIKNENNLRRLAPRKEYLQRTNLSNAELKARVDRLQLEDNLKRNVKVATAAQREIGKMVVDTSLKIGIEMYNHKKGKDSKSAGVVIRDEMIKFTSKKYKIVDIAAKMYTSKSPEDKK